MMVARDWGRESGEWLLNASRISVSPDEKVLELGCTTMQKYLTKPK